MSSIVVTTSRVPSFSRMQEVIAEECGKMRDEITDECARQCRRALVDTDSIATAKTLQSIKAVPIEGGTAGQFRGQVRAVKTWIFTDRGRGPGKMPIAKTGTSLRTGKPKFEPLPEIRAWFVIRGIEPAAWWPILRSIGKRGTRGKHFVRKALEVAAIRTRTIANFRARTLTTRLFSNAAR